jgi:hypothetical protein
VLALAGTSGAVLASTPVPRQVTGKVTGVTGDGHLLVDGKSYSVLVGSTAAKQLPGLHVGDAVGLVFDGPVAKGAHVIAVHRTMEGQP